MATFRAMHDQYSAKRIERCAPRATDRTQQTGLRLGGSGSIEAGAIEAIRRGNGP